VKVLVTGANGHVGFNLCQALLARGGYEVRASVRSLADGTKTAPLRALGGVELAALDVRDRAQFDAALKGVEILFHVAATYTVVTHGEAEAQGLQLHAPRHAQAEEAGEEVQRRRKGRTVERGDTAVVDPLEPEIVLGGEEVLRPRAPHEVEGGGVGPDHEVSAVVDVLAGHGIRERRCPPAEDAPPLEQRHLVTPLLEGDGRGQAREASADDDDPHRPQ